MRNHYFIFFVFWKHISGIWKEEIITFDGVRATAPEENCPSDNSPRDDCPRVFAPQTISPKDNCTREKLPPHPFPPPTG